MIEVPLYRSVMLVCFSAQDDATVKCWGMNINGQLGIGDVSNPGDGANGPCHQPSRFRQTVDFGGM